MLSFNGFTMNESFILIYCICFLSCLVWEWVRGCVSVLSPVLDCILITDFFSDSDKQSSASTSSCFHPCAPSRHESVYVPEDKSSPTFFSCSCRFSWSFLKMAHSHCAQRSLHDERSTGCQKHQWYVTTEIERERQTETEKERARDVKQSELLLAVVDYSSFLI